MPTFIFVVEPETNHPIAVVDVLGFQTGFALGSQFYILPDQMYWKDKIDECQGFAYSHPDLIFSFAKGLLMQVNESQQLGVELAIQSPLSFLICLLKMRPWVLFGKPSQEGHFNFPKPEYAEHLRHRFIKHGVDPEIKPIVQPQSIKEVTEAEAYKLIYGTTEETHTVLNYELTPTRSAMLGLGVDVTLKEPYEGAFTSPLVDVDYQAIEDALTLTALKNSGLQSTFELSLKAWHAKLAASIPLSTEQLAQFTNRWEKPAVKKPETHLVDTPLFKGITVIKHNRGGKKRRHNRGGKQ